MTDRAKEEALPLYLRWIRSKLPSMSTNVPHPSEARIHATARIAVVAARFNSFIVDELLAGCLRRLSELGAADDHVEVYRVPGAFELPVAAKVAAQTRRFSAVICLGCVIRGDTIHFEIVSFESSRGLMEISRTRGVPIGNGILTVDNDAQAWTRARVEEGDKGGEAARAALSLVRLKRRLKAG